MHSSEQLHCKHFISKLVMTLLFLDFLREKVRDHPNKKLFTFLSHKATESESGF